MTQKPLIALRYPNRRLAERLLECWEDGWAVLPVDPNLPPVATGQLLERMRPSIVEDQLGRNELPEGEPVPDGTALVLPTSGSSGPSKGVLLSHDALRKSARAVNRRIDAGDRRWLACLPFSHVAGIGILMRSMEAGTEPVIHDRFDIDAVAAEQEATLISLVPTTLKRLIEAGADLTRYHRVLVGGGPAPDGLIDGARAAGINIVTTYGMTETCGGCVYDGLPLPGVEMRVVDGLIELKGRMLTHGYRRNVWETEHAFTEDGWFRTADRGAIDAGGRLTVFGRVDDVIITGGKKVSAAEVEELLRRHPAVDDAAVVGIPDDDWGEAVAAVVESEEQVTLEEIRLFVAGNAPAYIAPKRLMVVEELPRTRSGKVRRDAVRLLLETD